MFFEKLRGSVVIDVMNPTKMYSPAVGIAVCQSVFSHNSDKLVFRVFFLDLETTNRLVDE